MGKQVAGLEGLEIDWVKVLHMPEVAASVEGARSTIESRVNGMAAPHMAYGGNTEPGKKKPRAPKGIVSTLGKRTYAYELRHNHLLSSL